MMKKKKCKVCEIMFEPLRPLQQNCSWQCANIYAQRLSEKKEKKEWQAKKAKMKTDIMTLKDWIKIAQVHFNNYIRERDKGSVCISCQKPPKKVNAGHFFNANNHWNVRFDEDNVHLQCESCNTYLSGNLIEYRANLINKIGVEKFEELEQKARITRKFTIDEVKQISDNYKEKLKQLK